MENIKICLSFVLIALYSAQHDAATTCQTIKDSTPDAPSGKYSTPSRSGTPVEIYCEMGLNGGGYTFLPPYSLKFLDNDEVSSMFTDRTSFLLRARKTDGTQPYAVLSQLSEYANIPLKLGLNNNDGYATPKNNKTIGPPYLYFSFLANNITKMNITYGLQFNGNRVAYRNCDGGTNTNNHLTLFPNFREIQPSAYYVPGRPCDYIFSNLTANPSGRVMPPEYFTFAETHWSCGCYTQTNRIPGIISLSIGFK